MGDLGGEAQVFAEMMDQSVGQFLAVEGPAVDQVGQVLSELLQHFLALGGFMLMFGPDHLGDGVGDVVGLVRRRDLARPGAVARGVVAGVTGQPGLQRQGLAERTGDPRIGAAEPIDLVRIGGGQRLGMNMPRQRQIQPGPSPHPLMPAHAGTRVFFEPRTHANGREPSGDAGRVALYCVT